jgi:hypothetical protein
LTAVSATPLALVNRFAAACAEPEFTCATELPWLIILVSARRPVSSVLM